MVQILPLFKYIEAFLKNIARNSVQSAYLKYKGRQF